MKFPSIPGQWMATMLLWVTPLIWSSNNLVARFASDKIAPNTLAFCRWLVALLVMLPYVWRDQHALRKLSRKDWGRHLALGALGVWICGAFVYIAGHTTTAGNISLIYAAAPIAIAVCNSAQLGVRPSSLQAMGLFSALLGVLYIISHGDLSTLERVDFVAGDAWVLMATAAWVAFTLLQQRWHSSLGAVPALFCTALCGEFILLPFAVAETWAQGIDWVTPTTLLTIAWVGVFPGLLSYLAYGHVVRHLGSNQAGLMLYLGPVYAIAMAWLLLHEEPQRFHAVGAILVLPSIYLATHTDSQPRQTIHTDHA